MNGATSQPVYPKLAVNSTDSASGKSWKVSLQRAYFMMPDQRVIGMKGSEWLGRRIGRLTIQRFHRGQAIERRQTERLVEIDKLSDPVLVDRLRNGFDFGFDFDFDFDFGVGVGVTGLRRLGLPRFRRV